MVTLVGICSATYFVVILAELLLRKKWLRFLLEAMVYLAVLALALLIKSYQTGTVSFGASGTSPIKTVGIMSIATILGTAARYTFYLEKGQFSWLDLLKPVAISPMVLLPLIGSVQTTGDLNAMQIVSFAFLAFQNGFFWQAVLAAAKPSLAKATG